MQSTLKLGRIFGIPIGVNYSWFVFFAVATGTLAVVYFPDAYPNWSTGTAVALGFVTSLLFFASVVAHELAHSAVSIRNGIPVQSITLFIFGGVARISQEMRKPKVELLMALAGPACSIGLAVFFGSIWLLVDNNEQIQALSECLLAINISLALFNLVPGFPMDGGRVLRAILWRISGDFKRATKIAATVGRVVAYAFILAGLAAAFYQYWNGLWFALVGWFLSRAATESYQRVALGDALKGVRARDLINYHYAVVPVEQTIAKVLQGFRMRSSRACCLVNDSGRLVGLVTAAQMAQVPENKRALTPIREVMTPWGSLPVAHPEDDVLNVVQLMEDSDLSYVPVIDGGVFVGLVDHDSLWSSVAGPRRSWLG
jgi:Zn-dependent protease/CBS domain-containing protein